MNFDRHIQLWGRAFFLWLPIVYIHGKKFVLFFVAALTQNHEITQAFAALPIIGQVMDLELVFAPAFLAATIYLKEFCSSKFDPVISFQIIGVAHKNKETLSGKEPPTPFCKGARGRTPALVLLAARLAPLTSPPCLPLRGALASQGLHVQRFAAFQLRCPVLWTLGKQPTKKPTSGGRSAFCGEP